MITPNEYTALLRQNNMSKDDKTSQFAQQNLEKFINYIDNTLKDRAEKADKSPTIYIDAYLNDNSEYSYALADLIAKEYAKSGWFIYNDTPSYPVNIRMRFSQKRLWWRRAWASPEVVDISL